MKLRRKKMKLRRKRKNEGRNKSFICVTAVNPKSGWLKFTSNTERESY